MRVIPAVEINRVLTFRELIECLRAAFRSDTVSPVRHHHGISRPGGEDATLLLMPAWTDFVSQGSTTRGYIGVKLVSVFPDNHIHKRPSVMGTYMLLSGQTGEPLAVFDGQSLTLWRTAAASALASGYLARDDAHRLLMVGAGALAPYLIKAHASVRPISEVIIWNRNPASAEALAGALDLPGISVQASSDLEGAARGADVISCATMSRDPLVQGEWLAPGTHLDLVGGFTPEMRETDDLSVETARLFVDTRAGALQEAGDIVQPLQSGLITEQDIAADLFELCRGTKAGRRHYNQITLFKSVGASIEDLAAAQHIFLRT
ncbi:MAG: ornithine cyclodeaminase family protein [Stappiaceae bacterium]